MVSSVKADFSEWNAGLDRLAGPGRESLARRMGVAGGVVIRDEAKQLAPVGKVEEQAQKQYGGSITPGSLRDAMYLAFNQRMSNSKEFTYTVTWNGKKAPHGHLVEMGYRQIYQVIFSKEKGWHTLVDKPLATPKFIPAYPFLRPAYDGSIQRAYNAMISTGQQELPKILRGET